MSRRTTSDAVGFSLVEVIAAVGLMAGVLLSVAGLLTVGQRQVMSGRSSSEALALARDILEELEGLGFHQSFESFGDDGSLASFVVDTRTSSQAAEWQANLDSRLVDLFEDDNRSHAEIRFDSINGTPTPPSLLAAEAIRITVTVFWSEGPRRRSVRLCTVRL